MFYHRYGGSSCLRFCLSAQLLEAARLLCSAAGEDHEMLISVMQNAYMFGPILMHTGNLQYLPVYTLEQKSCHYKLHELYFFGLLYDAVINRVRRAE
jgi:hypothetical protein